MVYKKKESRRHFSHIVYCFLQFMRSLSLCIKVTFHLWIGSVWFVGKGCPDNILKNKRKQNREGNVKSRSRRVSVKAGLLKIMTIKESWPLKLHHIEIT